ncbi:MAG: DUF362 domain-containing protein [Acidimicrobiales bacterium]
MSLRFSITPSAGDLRGALEQVAGDVGLAAGVGDSVFIKPNFTYPYFKPGVTTTRELLVELVGLLKDLGCRRVCLGEGDGGYNTFSMDTTFENFRLEELTRRYGLEVVNVGRWSSQEIEVDSGHGPFRVLLPRPVFEEFDSFISVPVPKVHCMTTISNGVKNQWGLIQDVMRLRLHLAFDEIITEINRRLPTTFVVVDGTFGLTANGPMLDGVALDLGWISACDNVWLNDALVCRLMGMPLAQVSHLAYAGRLGLMPASSHDEISGNFDSFCDDRFYLRRNPWNRLAKLTWHSPRLNHLAYFSTASGLMHRVMYSVRSKPDEISFKGVDWR